MSSDAYSYCKLCQINHTQRRKHIFAKKHQKRLKWVLQKYGKKIKECRIYLDNPIIQEGNYEAEEKFWCHCCYKEIDKHVSDHLKTILYGGVLEHLASEEHWECTDTFFSENGADNQFKISFIVSEKDINLFKSKLEPLVDTYNRQVEVKTKTLAKQIASQEYNRKLIVDSALIETSSKNSNDTTLFKTVKNKHSVVQNPFGYHDGVRVWRGGIVKYKQGSNQIRPLKYPSRAGQTFSNRSSQYTQYTVAAVGEGLTSLKSQFDKRRGNIYTGATPPWLRNDDDNDDLKVVKQYGPSMDDLNKYHEAKKKCKLNPNRVGANFNHSVNESENSSEWLPSFGRVWNNGARWKSRNEFHSESHPKKPRKL